MECGLNLFGSGEKEKEGVKEQLSSENGHSLSIYGESGSCAFIIWLNSTSSPKRSVIIPIRG